MLSKVLEQVLVLASISPVFVALWFSEFLSTRELLSGWFWLFLFLALVIISYKVIKFSEKNLEIMPIEIRSVAPADKEVAAFLIAYVLPFLNIIDINIWTEIFIVAILYVAVLTTGNYHFNPVLSLFGYHYYEVTIELSEKGRSYSYTYVLMTRKVIKDCREVKSVIQVSDYMLMEVER